MIALLLWPVALADEMAFACVTLTDAADGYPYVDAVPGDVVNAAIDELLAYVDASCAVATCTRYDSCEEVVDCVTPAGDLVDWEYAEAESWGGSWGSREWVEVVPAADRGLSWTRASGLFEYGATEIPSGRRYSYQVTYDGDWGEGWPTDGVVTAGSDYAKEYTFREFDDGSCAWSMTESIGEEFAWRVQVGAQILEVESDECTGWSEGRATLDGVYVGLVSLDGWEIAAPDADGDGVPDASDCGPEDATVSWCASERAYDGVDNDCVGGDEVDVDNDGYVAVVVGGDDCDDTDGAIHPGVAEVAHDGVDQDCVDGDLLDGDGDGYDADFSGGPDCDDADASIHPGASEVAGDGVDQDCNGHDPPVVVGAPWDGDPSVWDGPFEPTPPSALGAALPHLGRVPDPACGCGQGGGGVAGFLIGLGLVRRRPLRGSNPGAPNVTSSRRRA